ncbi:MAG: hypothetical protein COZ21_09455 [Bacteroidetes bacterium CG_4_10_14_3_um_filter_31_20]|nr:hypothetical protein [Bacteroidota bacterium]NCP79757.1 hypothetical protein [archaeon]OFX41708.1 MAG: hypothetical protein A2X08_17420 [Bacteroidetes bacterium GWA2_32_17]PIY03349.1 MAG: hypothetical protein COZ21_09455 [Bacteroidetes bacterium CG_4_10_14_3_um_filter_31_20]
MTNKEQIKRDIAVAFDFVEQIIDNPEILDKIPDGAAITFLDTENAKTERKKDKNTIKKYVKVKRHFEVL